MKYTKQETEDLIQGLRVTAEQCTKRADALLEEIAESEKLETY